MALIDKSVLVPLTAEQMFHLVDNVEEYPSFLPWCGGAELLKRSDERTCARIHINFHGVRTHFATENLKEAPHWMNIAFREGPFRRLDGGWRFTPLGDFGCKVEFRLHYEFSSRLLEKTLGPVFGHIVNTFVDSFVKRAHNVYG